MATPPTSFKAIHYKPYPALTAALSSNPFAGKSVIITGGGRGVGTSIANSFATAGAQEIILLGRTASTLHSTATSLSAAHPGTKFSYHVADITSASSVKAAFDKMPRSPDVLVNNAGYLAMVGNFVTADLTEFWKSYEVNILGTAIVTQVYLQHRRRMAPKPAPQVVVTTISTLSAYGVHALGYTSYGPSKAGQLRLMEYIADDVPPEEAKFVSVHPGLVETDMSRGGGAPEEWVRTEAGLVGDFVAWTALEEATFLIGRYAGVNWDVEALKAAEREIVEGDWLRTSVLGAGMDV